jgi:hypothetical protein
VYQTYLKNKELLTKLRSRFFQKIIKAFLVKAEEINVVVEIFIIIYQIYLHIRHNRRSAGQIPSPMHTIATHE